MRKRLSRSVEQSDGFISRKGNLPLYIVLFILCVVLIIISKNLCRNSFWFTLTSGIGISSLASVVIASLIELSNNRMNKAASEERIRAVFNKYKIAAKGLCNVVADRAYIFTQDNDAHTFEEWLEFFAQPNTDELGDFDEKVADAYRLFIQQVEVIKGTLLSIKNEWMPVLIMHEEVRLENTYKHIESQISSCEEAVRDYNSCSKGTEHEKINGWLKMIIKEYSDFSSKNKILLGSSSLDKKYKSRKAKK